MQLFQPGQLAVSAWPMLLGLLLILIFRAAHELTDLGIFLDMQRAAVISVAALAFLALHQLASPRILARSILYVVMCFFVYKLVSHIPAILAAGPREWDFLVFYLDSHVASAGLNLYSPDSYLQTANSLQLEVSHEFRREVIDVGFKSPPPTALLYLPLSYMELKPAHLFWRTFIAFMVFVACWMLSRLVTEKNSGTLPTLSTLDSIAFATILTLSIYSTGANIRLGQTNPLLFCFIVLTLIGSGKSLSGIAACFGIFIKPIAVIPALLLPLGKYWSGVVAGTLTGLSLIAISLICFGTDDWLAYLRQDYATTSPAWLYLQDNNKSLLAVLGRAFGITEVPWGHWPVVATYSALSFIFAAPSIWLAAKAGRKDFRTAYCFLLLMGLIVYPGTQMSYGMLLSIPIAVEFWNQYKSKERDIVMIMFIFAAVMLSNYHQFSGTVFIWLVFLRRILIITGSKDYIRFRPAKAN